MDDWCCDTFLVCVGGSRGRLVTTSLDNLVVKNIKIKKRHWQPCAGRYQLCFQFFQNSKIFFYSFMVENVCKVGKRFDNKPFAVAGKVLWKLSTLRAGPIPILDYILDKSPLMWVIVHLTQRKVAKKCMDGGVFSSQWNFPTLDSLCLQGDTNWRYVLFSKTEVKKVSAKNWLNHFILQILIIIVSYFLTNWDALPSSADRHFLGHF